MKKVLITGAAGFIGFHLAQKLHQRNDKVIGYDNFNAYYSQKLKRDRAAILQKLEIPIVEGDICDTEKLLSLVEKEKITHIVHLAAQAGVRYSLSHPQAYVSSNLEGFVSMLEVCRRHPSLPFIYASSSSVYGTNKTLPFKVTDPTDHPSNLYGATKKANEVMAFAYHQLFHIPMTGLRFFTVYGPWGRPDMAYFSFTKAILEGTPIDLYHNGEMQRDFTYIDDIVDGTVAAIDLGAPFEIFNLGNNNPEELLTFLEILERNLGKKAILRPLPLQPGEMLMTYADIAHSQQKLRFFPKVSLDEGLRRFVHWYQTYFF